MKKIFEATQVNNMELKNRLIRSALWMKQTEDDGSVNDQLINTYVELAKGGVGLIITGYAFIDVSNQPNPKMISVANDNNEGKLRELVDKVHQHNCKIALQIVSGGSQSHHPDNQSMTIYGPSPVKNIVTGLTPIEASHRDIKRIVDNFKLAARRAKNYGFDAIQIHAAHGYLLSQFLTPYYNRREDEYGGSIHNRARFIYEVVKAIREEVGKDYPIMIKLNHSDYMEDGLTEEDALEVFKEVDRLGVDLIEVSAVNESSGLGLMPARTKLKNKAEQSYFKEVTETIAKEVKAKVILMGGNRDVEKMEGILGNSDIEYFSIARPLLAESDLVNKWMVNKDYIPKCVSCNQCWKLTPNQCMLNYKEKINV